MHQYHDDWDTFPPAYFTNGAGRAKHSWRVLLLPYLEQQPLYDAYRFEEPWNGPNNRQLVDRMPAIYACPADHEHGLSSEITSYVVLNGPETAFPGNRAVSLDEFHDRKGNTVLVCEMADSGIPWLEPRDLPFDPVGFTLNVPLARGVSSYHRMGANFAFGDGSVRFLRDQVNHERLLDLMTIAGGEMMVAEEESIGTGGGSGAQ